MKVGSKRRRTREEILQQQQEEQRKLEAIEGNMKQWNQLEKELQQAKAEAKNNEGANLCIQHLIG